MKEPIKILFLAVCVFGCFTTRCPAIADKDGSTLGGVPPPLTVAKMLQGPSELSWEKLKGKVVVLEFWATWCGPCIQAMPHVNDLAEQFKDKPVVFISVTSENEEVVQQFLKVHPLKTWVGLDDYEVLNKAFHVQGIPHAVIIDASGRIAAIAHPATIKPENLEEVLAGKKCSLPEPEVYTVDQRSPEVVPNEAPALFEVSIREHKMPAQIRGPICMWSKHTNGMEGKIATVESALDAVFGKSSDRTVLKCKLPEGYYDFKLRAPAGHSNELQTAFAAALRSTFHLDARQYVKEMPVYILTQVNTNAPGLRRVDKPGGGGQMRGGFRSTGGDMSGVANDLEMALGKPVFNETGVDGFFSVDMKWKLSEAEQLQQSTDQTVWKAIDANTNGDWISTLPEELKSGEYLRNDLRLMIELAKPESEQFRPDPEAVVAAARERLGLQLTPGRRAVEVLEVNEVPHE